MVNFERALHFWNGQFSARVNNFKTFNDRHGHPCGDLALKSVAQTAQGRLQRPFDFICRWGGEEFVAVLPETPLANAISIAEALLQSVREIDLNVKGTALPRISISIGIVSVEVTPENFADDLVQMADDAMLRAKSRGRDRYAIFENA